MPATPPQLDLWLVAHLAMLLGRSPVLDLGIQQCVQNGVLGGIWYAAAIFVFWVQGVLPNQRNIRRRLLTMVLASLIAASLTIILENAISWPPPSAHPALASLYPEDFPVNFNATSFPSQSTALYTALAAGIYSLQRTIGVWAWVGVGILVALPRVYLGGHYITDVFAGLVAGICGYLIAIRLESTVVTWGENAFKYPWDSWRRIVAEGVLFLWILQVATGFSHVAWMASKMSTLWVWLSDAVFMN